MLYNKVDECIQHNICNGSINIFLCDFKVDFRYKITDYFQQNEL